MPTDDIEKLLKEREAETRVALERGEDVAAKPELDGSVGRLTRMDAMQQAEMAEHGQRRLRLQMDRIRGALQRVKGGTYGQCARCKNPVESARLEIVPETPFCTPCQTIIEEQGHV